MLVVKNLSLDRESVQVFEREAKARGLSLSAYLRLLAREVRPTRSGSRIRRDDHGFAAIVATVVVVVAVLVVVGLVLLGLSLTAVPSSGTCTMKGTTTPVSVTITVRKAVLDSSQNMVREVVGSTTSSPVNGAYTLITSCGNGLYDVIASKPGFDQTMLQSLDWNYPGVTTTWNPTLFPTTST